MPGRPRWDKEPVSKSRRRQCRPKTGLCSARAGEFKVGRGGNRLAGLHLAILAILRKFHGMSRYVQNTKGFRFFRDGADAVQGKAER